MSQTSSLFAADGCVIPNIRTRQYRIDFAAKCEHTKVRSASVFIEAESAETALAFAEKWLLQGPLGGQAVVAGVWATAAS